MRTADRVFPQFREAEVEHIQSVDASQAAHSEVARLDISDNDPFRVDMLQIHEL
jgi:hypothetical protein